MSKNNDANNIIQQNSSSQMTTTTASMIPTFNFSSTPPTSVFSFSGATTTTTTTSTTPSLERKKTTSKIPHLKRSQSSKSKRPSPYVLKEKPVAVAEINMVISQQSFEDFKKHPGDVESTIYSKSSEMEDTTKVIYIIFLILGFLIVISGYVIKKNFNDKKNSKKIREMIYI